MNENYKKVLNRSALKVEVKKKQKATSLQYLIGYSIGIFAVAPLILYWINHVVIQYPVSYWQYIVLSGVLYIALEVKIFSKIYTLALILILICQVLYWINLIPLPILHISH